MVRREFTLEEWRTLQFAPFWTFSAVVGVCRGFDVLDYDAFVRSLVVAAAGRQHLAGEVATSIASEPRRLTEEYGADPRPIAAGLCAVAAVLGKVPAAEAADFRDMLVSGIGEDVARARGRFGRVVSDEDAQKLELVAAILA